MRTGFGCRGHVDEKGDLAKMAARRPNEEMRRILALMVLQAHRNYSNLQEMINLAASGL